MVLDGFLCWRRRRETDRHENDVRNNYTNEPIMHPERIRGRDLLKEEEDRDSRPAHERGYTAGGRPPLPVCPEEDGGGCRTRPR